MSARLKGIFSGGAMTGTAVLFVSMTLVNGGNYLFNLLLGRWLGPEAFADLSLIVTLMLMITFVTVTFQLTAAKFAAMYQAAGDEWKLSALHTWLGRQGWLWGTAVGLILAGGAPLWQRFFHTESPWPFVILGIGLPIYFAQGIGRGLLQGESRFSRLALSYQAEMWVRLAIGLVLVAAGAAVNGAVLAISLSFVATWFVARRRPSETAVLPQKVRQEIARYALPVLVVHLGQILINNSDILIVKRYFSAGEAGQYAALALIGRMVFFATWSVVTVIFPLVAQRQQRGEPHRHLLGLGLAAVTGVSALIILATVLFPNLIMRLLFGSAYLAVAPLLWQYALATTLYALANVIVSYRLSLGQGLGSYLTVIAGAAQVIALVTLHASLSQVIWTQIGLMGGLLVMLAIWDLGQELGWSMPIQLVSRAKSI